MADGTTKASSGVHCITRMLTLVVTLAFAFGNGAHATELYAQAIGQPPERQTSPPPPPPAKPPVKPSPPAEAPPETTARTEPPPAEGNLRTRILIGAGIALALAALGGGGGGGTEAPPASTPAP